MANLAKVYGLNIWTHSQLNPNEFYEEIGNNAYLTLGDYAVLQDILAENGAY